jgi:small conductance mechanosensitive channel
VPTDDAAAAGSGWDDFVNWVAWLLDSGWGSLVRVIIIVLVAMLVRVIVLVLIRRSVERIVTGVKRKYQVDETRQLTAQSPVSAVRRVQRTRSLGSVLKSAVTWAIVIVAMFLIFYTLFPGATSAFAIVAAAIGAGLGIGAQGLVRDVMNGIFFVSEDQLGIGDVVDVGPAIGVVEDVGIRVTKLRDVDGTLWFVRNGEINRVGNRSQGWARAIIDLAVPYDTDVDAAKDAILEAGESLVADPAWKTRLLDKPALWGMESISTEAIVLRFVVTTRSSAKDDVRRELQARIKTSLDKHGVILPSITTIRIDGEAVGGRAERSERAPRTKPTPKVAPKDASKDSPGANA